MCPGTEEPFSQTHNSANPLMSKNSLAARISRTEQWRDLPAPEVSASLSSCFPPDGVQLEQSVSDIPLQGQVPFCMAIRTAQAFCTERSRALWSFPPYGDTQKSGFVWCCHWRHCLWVHSSIFSENELSIREMVSDICWVKLNLDNQHYKFALAQYTRI